MMTVEDAMRIGSRKFVERLHRRHEAEHAPVDAATITTLAGAIGLLVQTLQDIRTMCAEFRDIADDLRDVAGELRKPVTKTAEAKLPDGRVVHLTSTETRK